MFKVQETKVMNLGKVLKIKNVESKKVISAETSRGEKVLVPEVQDDH